MKKPANNSRSEAETDRPATAGLSEGRLKGINHTMKKRLWFFGLDVHVQNIATALAEGGGDEAHDVKNSTAYAFRMAARSLQRSQMAFGDFFRRLKPRLGAPGRTPPPPPRTDPTVNKPLSSVSNSPPLQSN